MSRLRDLAVGVAASVALVVFFVAIPWVLVAVVGWPLPTTVPSWAEITGALEQGAIDDTTIIKAIALVVWIAWFQLAVVLVAEIVSQLRGRSVRRFGPSGLHLLAGRWVAQAALIFAALSVSAPALAAPLPTWTPGVERPTTAGSGTSIDLRTTIVAPDTPTTAHAVHLATHRDTWLSLAERYLGDAGAWRELHALNVGRRQPDGTTIGKAGAIRTGWRLIVPTTASPAAVRVASMVVATGRSVEPVEIDAAIASADPSVVTVARGDHLWGLAERALHDAWGRPPTDREILPFWVETVARNADLPSGDPDLIHPGDRITLPPVPADAVVAPEVDGDAESAEKVPVVEAEAEAESESEPGAGASGPTEEMPVAELVPLPPSPGDDAGDHVLDGSPPEAGIDLTDTAPSNLRVPPGDGAAGAGPPAVAPPATSTAPAGTSADTVGIDETATSAPAGADDPNGQEDQGAEDDRRDLAEVVGRAAWGVGGASVAAGVLFTLRRRRRVAMIRRPAGHALVGPPPPSVAVETAAVAASEGRTADDDLTRRVLGAVAPARPEPHVLYPHPLLVTHTGDDISLLLDLPAMGLPPIFSADTEGRAVTIGIGGAARLPPATTVDPSPAWVTVGSDRGPVRLSLEAVGTLNVAGTGAAEIVSSMIVELRSGPGAEQVLVIADDAAPIPGLDGLGEVVRVEPELGWSRIAAWMDGVDRHLAATGLTSAFAARAGGTDDPWPVLVAVTATAPPPELQGRVARGGRAVAIVGVDCLESPRAELRSDGPRVQLWPFGLDLAAQRVPTETIEALRALWDAALAEPAPLPLFDERPAGEDGVGAEHRADSDTDSGPEGREPARTGREALFAAGASRVTSGDGGDEDAPVVVRVLGPVDVTGGKEPIKGQQAALLGYLATRATRSATADQVRDAIWAGHRISTGRLHSVSSALRQRLPVRATLPPAESSVYRVDGITTDLARFQHLVDLAQHQDLDEMVTTLLDALDLVRGPPFTISAVHEQWWRWVDVEMLRTATEALVADVAHRLALVGLDRDEPQLALRAAGQGLLASPHAEILVADLLRAHCRAGQRATALGVLDAHEQALADLGLDVDDDLRLILHEESAVG